jgi:hypothetical protein
MVQLVTFPPFGFTDPASVAEVCVTDDGASVVTVGGGGATL